MVHVYVMLFEEEGGEAVSSGSAIFAAFGRCPAGDTMCRQEEIPVVGRLRQCVSFSEEISSDQWVLNVI